MENVNTEGCQVICAMEVGTSAEQVLERQREDRDLAMASRHNEAMKRCHTHVMDPRKRGQDELEVTWKG